MTRLCVLLALAACSGENQQVCDVATNFGCDPALQCETVEGRTEPTCLSPVVVRGAIYDISSHLPVMNPRILVIGADGAPIGAAITGGSDGTYQVRISAPRDASFQPLSKRLTLWVSAPGFGTFPDRWRAAPVLDLVNAKTNAAKDALVLASSDTDVPLLPFGGGPGRDVLSGKLPPPTPNAPVLVVAVTDSSLSGPLGVSTLADGQGGYVLYGLPPAQYTIRAYTKGANYGEAPIALSAGEQTSLNLPSNPTPTSKVSGRIQIAGAGTPPTVALFIAGTYDVDSGRGDLPQGLTTTASSDGSFSLSGVPSGRYVVVPSPDNDGQALVGAPLVDAPPTVDVTAGVDAIVTSAIRIAPAVKILGPGANGPEALVAPPTLSWQAVSGAESYRVTVISGVDVAAWEPKTTTGTTIPYGGQFAAGGFYRFRVQALDGKGVLIASSEDLRGIFYQPGP